MSHNNTIISILNLQDERIELAEDCYKRDRIKGVESHVIKASLTYEPESCYHFNVAYSKRIEKHGYVTTRTKLPSVSNMNTYLILRKQRYYCTSCTRIFVVATQIVKKFCNISNSTKIAIALDLVNKKSVKDVAKQHNVSPSTVDRVMDTHYQELKPKLNYLPEKLCFDEFKSVKSARGSMSFIYCDASNGKLINIVEDRRLSVLVDHFLRYTKRARDGVKRIVIDMYSPYISLIKKVFPKAKIVIDKFHVVQLLSRAFNKTRVGVMNANKHIYNKLKRYWKLFLMPYGNLDCLNFRKCICFKKFMSQRGIVEYLLNQNEELKATYWAYQDLLYAIRNKDIDAICQTIKNIDPMVSNHLKKSINTLVKYLPYIENMINCSLSNGYIEGLIGKIKVIKRIAFGYRSFIRFKARIMITQNLCTTNF